MGVGAGVADLDDVSAFVRAAAGGLYFPDRVAKRADETIVMQGRVFQRRLPRLVDADGRRNQAGDAALGKPLLEMNPCRGNRAVIIRRAAADRRTEDAIVEGDVFDAKRLKQHNRLQTPDELQQK